MPNNLIIKDLTKEIEQAVKLFDLTVSVEQIALFNHFINLLAKWNKSFNLTAVRDINEMLDRHLIDSLSIANKIKGNRLIDVGTGPGLPGIPLAILYPKKTFSLLDSNGKKSRFQQQVKQELGLNNIEIINSRVEAYQPEEKYDGVLSRAFATLEDMLKGANHLCHEEGYYFAMKGLYPQDELQRISKPYKVHSLDWPGNNTERHLVIIAQNQLK